MLYYQPLKIKSYKMRLIFIIFIFLMIPACSWLDPNESDEENVPVGQEDDDTDISIIPLINIITKFLPETYRQDISQGNEITPEMLLEIQPGMNKSQVRFVLGTSLIQDSFHKNRWDYIYVVRKEGKFIESRHLILTFKKDKLVNLTGDLIDRNKDVKTMEFQNAKEWDEESLAEEQKKFGDIEDKKEMLEKSNSSIDNEQIQPVEEPIKKNAVEESGSVSQSVKEDLNASLPDKEDPGYFELLIDNIGF
jgi:outer membrane protein assembly factor BamE (lipoprotein component of BamABCDE complex)